MKDKLDILVTFNENYVNPFKVMLKSLQINNVDYDLHVWLIRGSMDSGVLANLKQYCAKLQVEFSDFELEENCFSKVKITARYHKEMYYRFWAAELLPTEVKRVLYIDPDTLIINPLNDLWNLNMDGYSFAAASHTGITDFTENVNRVRLDIDHVFYNTGVILIDLDSARNIVKLDEIINRANNLNIENLYPDQDLFNILYGKNTLQLDDTIWNYDPRFYKMYSLRSNGVCNLDWVIRNTAIIHFCGRKKPWLEGEYNNFSLLYKHYMRLLERSGDLN